MPIREIIARMRHDGCGGRAGKVELMTGIAIEAHFVGRKRTTIMEVARDALKIETPSEETRSATDCRRPGALRLEARRAHRDRPPQDAADPIQVSVWPTVYAVQSEARPGRSPGWMIAF